MIKKMNPNRKVTLTVKQIEQMRKEASNRAISIMSYFPVWVLRTKFGFGRKRIERYMGEFADLMDSYNKDYVKLEDIAQALKDEVGVEWEDE